MLLCSAWWGGSLWGGVVPCVLLCSAWWDVPVTQDWGGFIAILMYMCACICRKAELEAQFWCFLQDFVGQIYAPEEWRAVGATHPFIGVLVEGERARMLLPPGVEW